MKEMARENEEAEAEYARKQEELLAKHAPFSGPGHSLTAPSPAPAPPTAVSHAHWSPVTVDPGKPSGNIQVGSVMVMMMMMMMMVVIMVVMMMIIINTRISRRVTIVTWCHNCDTVCHNCDILFVKMLELGSEIIPKN